MTGQGLTVEQVPDARLVEWMCQMRPGLPVQYADLALQALRSLHMTVHRDDEPCERATGPGPVHECRAWDVALPPGNIAPASPEAAREIGRIYDVIRGGCGIFEGSPQVVDGAAS